MKNLYLILVSQFLSFSLFSQSQIPSWFMEDCEFMIGKWISDNKTAKSEEEPYDTYVTEWEWSPGKKGISGKLSGNLFGLTVEVLWEFNQYWDIKENKGVVLQLGSDGTIGRGYLTQIDSLNVLIQDFTGLSGNSYSTKHENLKENSNKLSSASYSKSESGKWIANPKTVWLRDLPVSKEQCKCCTEAHDDFDYWEGDWVVSDTAGRVVGHNRIEKILGECTLLENWTSGGANRGKSFNYYDPSDKSWNQLWLDNGGSILKLKGGLEEGNMVLKSELLPGKKVDYYYNQITWTKNKDGSVTQSWDIKSKDGKLLQNAFKGIYRRKDK